MVAKPYLALSEFSSHTLIEKKSQFVALLYPIKHREEVKSLLKQARYDYPGASHYCWAFIVGAASKPEYCAFCDDGEPYGSAGKPMINVLNHNNMGGCLAVVARFFGGVKLGVGGLMRAYSQSVSEALNNAKYEQVKIVSTYRLTCSFEHESKLRYLFELLHIPILSVKYSHNVNFMISSDEIAFNQLKMQAEEVTSGSVVFNNIE